MVCNRSGNRIGKMESDGTVEKADHRDKKIIGAAYLFLHFNFD